MHDVHFAATFNAPVEHLFMAFGDASLLQQWFAPGDLLVSQVMTSFKEGGKFSVHMLTPEQETHVLHGHYLTLKQAQELSFTWQWQPEGEVTQVGLLFNQLDANTSELVLSHSGFTDPQVRDQHQGGWIACLEKLSLITLPGLRQAAA